MSALGPANTARTERSRSALSAALEQDTVEEALKVWGGSSSAFWKAAKRYGRREEAKRKFAHKRAPRVGEDRLTREELIEDAEWLAKTGENQEGSARRLGFHSWDSLYARLSNYNRLDIADRITRNGETSGWVHQGTVFSSRNGARL